MKEQDSRRVIMGRVSGLFGVRGWVKIFSHTKPRANILEYPRWQLLLNGEWKEVRLVQGKPQGKGLVAKLEGIDDRDLAATLIGADVAVDRDNLPATEEDEFYWSDLEGLLVLDLNGRELGRLDHLFETGANDVMVVKGERERLIPFVGQVVREVDLTSGRILVEWDPDF